MFGSLKKRLKEVFKKAVAITEEVKPKKEKPEIKEGIEKPEEIIEETTDIIAEKEDEIKEVVKEEEIEKGLTEKIEEMIEPEIKEEAKPEPILEKEKYEEKAKEIREEIEEGRKEEKKEKKGFISRLIPSLVKKVKEKKLSENEVDKILNELKIALLENDVALVVAEKICDDVKKDLMDKSVNRSKVGEVVKNSLHTALLDVMKQEKIDLEKLIEKKQPFTIIFLGFNGTGKTTSMAKLAHKLKKYKPVLAAADTFRAASIEQLEEHANKLNVDLVKHKYGSDSAAVIFDARKHAEATGSKLVLADTAGRSHANINLMDELKKVCRVNNPDMKILVLDSLTGNDIYEQTKLFNESVGVDAIILTKADVYEKGGAALSASYTIKKPILYLGIGQSYDDLKEFSAEEIADGLLK